MNTATEPVKLLPLARRLVEVVACPYCTSLQVDRKDWRTGDLMAHWRCRACRFWWKEPKEVGGMGKRLTSP